MMTSRSKELNAIEESIMSGLKDFQQATVNRVDQLFRQNQMRVLVSDEVGLGKTLIARGTIAKLAKMRQEQGDNLVKVVYICSNAAIADQNLDKLRISGDIKKERSDFSRLSMQHLNIFRQENDPEILKSYIQLIPLTPDTSFRITNGSGTVNERALMFTLLRRLPFIRDHVRALDKALECSATSSWNSSTKEFFESEVKKVNEKSGGEYIPYMLAQMDNELSKETESGRTLRFELEDIIRRIEENHYKSVPNNDVIGKLRVSFARISLQKLEPDLVIMDEFQRFKYLLNADPGSETGMLAGKFFNSDGVRMLLLSATPYKMYSTLEELDENDIDEHFTEFLDVMKFLNLTEESHQAFREVWSNYSVSLKEMSSGDATLIQAKNAAEKAMYKTVCRTERNAAFETTDMIDDSDVRTPIHVSEADVKSYLQAQRLLEKMGASFNVPIDYVKSTPYLMSFMRDYQLKREVEKYFRKHPAEVGKMRGETFWIDRNKINKYSKIPNNNARLDHVMKRVFTKNAELLLWMPPSRPYYESQGVYRGVENFSKTIVFSSWEMVPRMIASLISYEAERLSVGKMAIANDDRDAHYFTTGERRYPSARLNFSLNNGEPHGMSLFCLLYPSQFLSQCYNPIDCMNRGMSLREIEREIKYRIKEKLSEFDAPVGGSTDNRWYYLAPLLFDKPGYVKDWLNKKGIPADHDEEKKKKQKGFTMHFKTLSDLYFDVCEHREMLGKKPNDLVDVLTDMAIASPAVCVKRTYELYCTTDEAFANYRPSQIARLFMNRMNTVESTAAVELACGRKSDDAHWQNVLTYCKQGNMQAMFDEYAHLLVNGLDESNNLVKNLHEAIAQSLDFRTTVYNADTYNAFCARMEGRKERLPGIRSHFAVAFIKGDNKDSDADRKKAVRNAFNSPFRPFLLASTSIGQEGLDFHNYCRRIVHWNLPSNPIEIEQREGRINRFECLAIRQNVAKRYGNIRFKSDIWDEMFKEAERVEKTKGCSDLIPYWKLKESEDMVKMERIVPMYPFSRDGNNYEHLMKILSFYRLTLGQPRQEELLEYIFDNCDNLEDQKKMFINLSPFYREHDGNSGEEEENLD